MILREFNKQKMQSWKNNQSLLIQQKQRLIKEEDPAFRIQNKNITRVMFHKIYRMIKKDKKQRKQPQKTFLKNKMLIINRNIKKKELKQNQVCKDKIKEDKTKKFLIIY